MEPNTIQLRKSGKEILTIHADGRITVSEDLKPTETAAEVLQIMRDQWLADAQCTKIRELNERIKLLEYGIAKQNLEIEQTCGKVLDYPWFKDDQKNFPGATEKDGVCVGEHVAETIAAELARKYTEAKDRIKRLEEALESIREYWNRDNNNRAMIDACWYAIDKSSEALEAKEAKP
jgi:hypothetical protein